MKKTEESLYIKVLIWAYDRKQKPFTIEDLFEELEIEDPIKKKWVYEMFLIGPVNSYPLFHGYMNAENKMLYLLSDKGMSATVSYLSLKESQGNSRRAERIALWALGITSMVGIIQIVIAINK